MKFINWLKAVWLSFRVAQNVYYLMFLKALADDMANQIQVTCDEECNRVATLRTYRNVIKHWLSRDQYLDSSIWPLEKAHQLFQKSTMLIEIGEMIIYGPDQSGKTSAEAEIERSGDRAAEGRA